MLKETDHTQKSKMPALSGAYKRAIGQIPTPGLQKLVMRAAALGPGVYDVINL